MKRTLLAATLLFALTKGYGQTYPLRYSVFIDSIGIQHTSTIPTKMIAITGNLNDAVVKFSTLAQSGIADVYTKTQTDGLYVPTTRTITINGTTLDMSADRSWTISTSAPVSSVYGRTGAVIASTNDYTFAQIGSKPTTLSGYGITDAMSNVPLPSNTLSKSANYTILSTDFVNGKSANLVVRVNCSGGAVTITLPSALNGYSVTVIKTDNSVNLCTVSGLTGDNLIASQNQSRIAVSDASTWNNN